MTNPESVVLPDISVTSSDRLVNRTKERLAQGEPVAGCFLRYPDPALAELLAICGVDFVVLDGEHGPLDVAACENMARALELHGATPIVRTEENRPSLLLRYLDAGALGCHVPGIETAEDARDAVAAIKFRPTGHRGLAASRSSGFGPSAGFPNYVEQANRATLLVVHIETQQGVKNVEEIAAVEGVDVLLLGSLDLSHDLGVTGQLDHPHVQAAGQSIQSAARRRGKTFGAVASGERSATEWRERGAAYIVFPVESLIRPTLTGLLTAVRGPLKETQP